MSLFITVSGPQSSGKSTVFKYLESKYSKRGIKFIKEINPYEFKKTDHPKYLSTHGIQETLTKMTLSSLGKITSKKNHIMETGPMQIVYVEKYEGLKKANLYFKKYLKIVKPLNPIIIFIDTKPEISFRRRKQTYITRIKKHNLQDRQKQLLNEYKNKIFDLYPLWHKWLRKFPYKKIVIKNSYKSEDKFIKEVDKIIRSLLPPKSRK